MYRVRCKDRERVNSQNPIKRCDAIARPKSCIFQQCLQTLSEASASPPSYPVGTCYKCYGPFCSLKSRHLTAISTSSGKTTCTVIYYSPACSRIKSLSRAFNRRTWNIYYTQDCVIRDTGIQ
ncbi:hypothetical protein PoB_000872500 [Plakobranchus ocellatus]|uniref:Uncharacterized protein n=1 Tax=Plakobranchus ocellatus TaxID=259542 RepID=A0AAV3YGK8_9GAST|nr:hypothetical protein PoB_000872500 [Plakobranchus ocellatus]